MAYINIKSATKTITSSEILSLNTTPIEVIAAPGSGKAIQVVGALAETASSVGSSYGTNTDLGLFSSGAGTEQALNTGILLASAAEKSIFSIVDSGIAADNNAINAKVKTGDPTAGDFDVKITVLYTEIEV